jgi:hypothetical protein
MKRKQMDERLVVVESEVAKTEAIISDCEQQLGNFVSVEETQRLTNLMAEKRAALEVLEDEWATLSEDLEQPE